MKILLQDQQLGLENKTETTSQTNSSRLRLNGTRLTGQTVSWLHDLIFFLISKHEPTYKRTFKIWGLVRTETEAQPTSAEAHQMCTCNLTLFVRQTQSHNTYILVYVVTSQDWVDTEHTFKLCSETPHILHNYILTVKND